MRLIDNPRGGYRFLTGIAPYSSGVVAAPGYQISRATLRVPLPYRQGFELIEWQLAALGRPRAALCAVELRAPRPWSFAGFASFNADYQRLLAEWGLLLDGYNPVARTNVAPALAAPSEPALYAYSYSLPSAEPGLPITFVVAGAGELPEGELSAEAIVRAGETTAEAIAAKATFVMGLMRGRVAGLGVTLADMTAIDLYTLHSPAPFLENVILEPLGPAAVHGVHWHYSRPPIEGLDFEMDMRGVHSELWVSAAPGM
jgi:hypothetical protein